MKKTALTGIQQSGIVTLGNYLGAIKNFVAMQDEYSMNVMIANLHSITVPYERASLKSNTLNLAKLYIACGLDPEKVNLFVQSDVLEHSQLSHILLCNTTMSELKKMTQFKDKTNDGGIDMGNGTKSIPTGLFTYPALMSADILLYQPDIVPVGEDQKQHVELTRNIAERINTKFGEVFKVPDPVIQKVGARIMSLTEPTKKMSKSDPNIKSFISLLDDPKIAKKKIMSAMMDSDYPNVIKYDKNAKPGVSNMLEIYAAIKSCSIEESVGHFKTKSYKELKEEVANNVEALLMIIQEKYNKITNSQIVEILEKGAIFSRRIASKNLNKIQNKLGINYVKK